METKFSNKLSEIHLHYKIWMSDERETGIMGDGKWQMLKLIEEKGSMKAACDELGYTYRRTWGNLKKIEKFLKKIDQLVAALGFSGSGINFLIYLGNLILTDRNFTIHIHNSSVLCFVFLFNVR